MQPAHDPVRPIGDALADVLEDLLRLILGALPDDTSRKRTVMALRERGHLSDEAAALAFMWFPGLRDA